MIWKSLLWHMRKRESEHRREAAIVSAHFGWTSEAAVGPIQQKLESFPLFGCRHRISSRKLQTQHGVEHRTARPGRYGRGLTDIHHRNVLKQMASDPSRNPSRNPGGRSHGDSSLKQDHESK